MKYTVKLKKFIPFLLLLMAGLFVSVDSYSQYENTSGQKKEGDVKKRPAPQKMRRWFAGGMLGAGFSTYSSYVEVSPIVGYRLTENFQIGTRFTYIYNSVTAIYYNPYYFEDRINLNHYGASLFARYIIYKGIFAQAEYEYLSLNNYFIEQVTPTYNQIVTFREPINSFFIGGGFFQNIGGRGFASFAVLFNVLDSPDSPYINPVIRLGFGAFF